MLILQERKTRINKIINRREGREGSGTGEEGRSDRVTKSDKNAKKKVERHTSMKPPPCCSLEMMSGPVSSMMSIKRVWMSSSYDIRSASRAVVWIARTELRTSTHRRRNFGNGEHRNTNATASTRAGSKSSVPSGPPGMY